MEWNLMFFVNSVLLGAGLAMDAFSVSLANGLNEPQMKRGKICGIAGVFAGFQALMPMLGWICVHTIVQYFHAFEQFIPWIAFVLLLFIGGKMALDGIKGGEADTQEKCVGIGALMLQGIATSIDALSVGFTIANYQLISALAAAFIIAVVTFVICVIGLLIGRKFGVKLAGKAQILGGLILIGIGIEILVSSFLG